MTQKQNGLGLAAVVVGVCLGILVLVIALTARDGAQDDSSAIGFPIVIVGLVVLGGLGAMAWRAVTRKDSSRR